MKASCAVDDEAGSAVDEMQNQGETSGPCWAPPPPRTLRRTLKKALELHSETEFGLHAPGYRESMVFPQLRLRGATQPPQQ